MHTTPRSPRAAATSASTTARKLCASRMWGRESRNVAKSPRSPGGCAKSVALTLFARCDNGTVRMRLGSMPSFTLASVLPCSAAGGGQLLARRILLQLQLQCADRHLRLQQHDHPSLVIGEIHFRTPTI